MEWETSGTFEQPHRRQLWSNYTTSIATVFIVSRIVQWAKRNTSCGSGCSRGRPLGSCDGTSIAAIFTGFGTRKDRNQKARWRTVAVSMVFWLHSYTKKEVDSTIFNFIIAHPGIGTSLQVHIRTPHTNSQQKFLRFQRRRCRCHGRWFHLYRPTPGDGKLTSTLATTFPLLFHFFLLGQSGLFPQRHVSRSLILFQFVLLLFFTSCPRIFVVLSCSFKINHEIGQRGKKHFRLRVIKFTVKHFYCARQRCNNNYKFQKTKRSEKIYTPPPNPIPQPQHTLFKLFHHRFLHFLHTGNDQIGII